MNPPPPPPKKELSLGGPRPSPLKVSKDSHKIRKSPPVPSHPASSPSHPASSFPLPPPATADHKLRLEPVIYNVSPEDFRSAVELLTGAASSSVSTSGAGDFSSAARLASIEKTSLSDWERELKLLMRTGEQERQAVEVGEVDNPIEKIDSAFMNVGERSHVTPIGLDQLRGGGEEISVRVSDLTSNKLLEKNIKELVVELTKEGDAAHRVVCIWGMGGIGKTTLASQIYHHPQIRSNFGGFAWVTVSDNTIDWLREEDRALTNILLQLTNTTDAEISEIKGTQDAINHLSLKLKNLMESKKYLVILDDIWSEMALSMIDRTLISKFSNIRILLTTRNKGLTSGLGASIFFHELRCLDQQQSWELFEEKANFKTHVRDLEYNEMKKLGEKLLECYGGLPLAISMLGEILSEARTTSEWHDIMFDKVKRNVRKGKTKELGEFKSLSRVLGLSYDDLPCYWRECFLHLAHFPKDSEIRVKELCQIWAAEHWDLGEEKAYEIIDGLVQRGMLQVEKLDLRGRIKTLRIHNLMRQLCLVKAKMEGFVEISDSRNIHNEVDVLFDDMLADFVPTDKPSRIAIYLNKDVAHEMLPLIESSDRQGSLVSLICFNSQPYPSYEPVMKPLLKRFHTLTIFKFENLTQGYIGNLPEEIGQLTRLRFLSLKGSHVEQVPSSIGNLVFLRTLDLRTKWSLKLPDVIWKLEELRHLYLGHRSHISGNQLRLGNLRNLQTLVNIPMMCCDFRDLIELTRLKKLLFYVHARWWKKSNLGSIMLDGLESLAVENLSRARIDLTPFISSCHQIMKLHLEGNVEKLPEAKGFPKLIKLTLNRTDLEDDPMTTLGKLPNLRYLLLKYNAFKGNTMLCSSRSFPHLESLSLVALEQLKEWRIEKGALPRLGYLLIEYCYELEAIPDGLRCVTSLKKLVIKRMPREFEMKVEESGNDFYKEDQHVLDSEFLDDEQLNTHPSDSAPYECSPSIPDSPPYELLHPSPI